MTPDEEDALITKDRLIIATCALERIRALGGRAAKIADETLQSFALADKDDPNA